MRIKNNEALTGELTRKIRVLSSVLFLHYRNPYTQLSVNCIVLQRLFTRFNDSINLNMNFIIRLFYDVKVLMLPLNVKINMNLFLLKLII